MSAPSPITTIAWWQDLAQRAWRQAYQTAAPILQAIVSQGAGSIEPKAVVVGLLGAEAVTLFKFVVLQFTTYEPSQDSRAYVRVGERVLPAIAGVYAGVALTGLSDFLTVDWAQTTYLAVVAGVLAAIASNIDPAQKPQQ